MNELDFEKIKNKLNLKRGPDLKLRVLIEMSDGNIYRLKVLNNTIHGYRHEKKEVKRETLFKVLQACRKLHKEEYIERASYYYDDPLEDPNPGWRITGNGLEHLKVELRGYYDANTN